MPNYEGPCIDCGEQIKRYLKPGKRPRCLSCGLVIMAQNHRDMHAHTGPEYEKAAAGGRASAAQIRARKGTAYDRWRMGMIQAANRGSSTSE